MVDDSTTGTPLFALEGTFPVLLRAGTLAADVVDSTSDALSDESLLVNSILQPSVSPAISLFFWFWCLPSHWLCFHLPVTASLPSFSFSLFSNHAQR